MSLDIVIISWNLLGVMLKVTKAAGVSSNNYLQTIDSPPVASAGSEPGTRQSGGRYG